ncbi:MAG: acyltransferase [Anaerolineales bacterium]|nr:acyltransferase [Anaerolineales bacterium]
MGIARMSPAKIASWEFFRWLIIILGDIPGVVGVFLRYLFLRPFFKHSDGFFRMLERVVVEYPHGLSLGKDVGFNIGCWVNARGDVTIGDYVILGPYCVIHSANHNMESLDVPVQQQGFVEMPVTIGDNVWMGARVTVLPGVTIGENAVIGAGAVVTKDIPPNAIAVGNPAQVLRLRTEEK